MSPRAIVFWACPILMNSPKSAPAESRTGYCDMTIPVMSTGGALISSSTGMRTLGVNSFGGSLGYQNGDRYPSTTGNYISGESKLPKKEQDRYLPIHNSSIRPVVTDSDTDHDSTDDDDNRISPPEKRYLSTVGNSICSSVKDTVCAPYEGKILLTDATQGIHDTREGLISEFPLTTKVHHSPELEKLLTEGILPPQNKVRIEEFVNYFSYGYAAPTNGALFSVSCMLKECPWDSSHLLLRIAFRRTSDATIKRRLSGNRIHSYVEFNVSQVASYRLLGYTQTASVRHYEPNAFKTEADIAECQTVFYELTLASSSPKALQSRKLRYSPESNSKDLLTVGIRQRDSDDDDWQESSVAVSMSQLTSAPDADFDFASAVAEFALLLQSESSTKASALDSLIKRADQSLGEDRTGERSRFVRIAKLRQRILNEMK